MDKQKAKHVKWSWEATGAFFSFVGGILAGLVGSVLTALTWIVGAVAHPWLRGIGTALFIVTIPLLIFAGYCLDWMEDKTKNQTKGVSDGEQGRSRGNEHYGG